jgi:16S rRNA (cytosine1402-N4)-methyltransferase
LQEVLAVLAPQPGEIAVDCTVGWAGHAVELLCRLGPQGRLIGIDWDAENLPRAQERLEAVGTSFQLHHGNFAGLPTILAAEGLTGVDLVLADLGMSSMQVDDPERGFSYARNGPLDMRMDRSRGRSAAQLLATISAKELEQALRDLGDEPEAAALAAAIVAARRQQPLLRTQDLVRIVIDSVQSGKSNKVWRLQPSPRRWNLHPAARTFQTLRLLVNRELANLEQLLRVLPDLLRPRGRAAIISFHSGEDRRVKAAFREGFRTGLYERISSEPLRASWQEYTTNPRSRSAKLRWVQRGQDR